MPAITGKTNPGVRSYKLTGVLLTITLVGSLIYYITLPRPFPYTELVLKPGDILTANTASGKMQIQALGQLERRYTWDGASRSVSLWPREKRWYGSLGAYYPGEGEHWKDNNGITRGVLDEGRQDFPSQSEALSWLYSEENEGIVYRDDGLAVNWGKTLSRHQLNVDVWQILIAGKKPKFLPGSHNDSIVLKTNQ
jgi:hypothetical protein